MSAWCRSIHGGIFVLNSLPPLTHLLVETAGSVEMHAGVESARARNGTVAMVFGNVHNLRHRVLIHSTAHIQLEGSLTRDLPDVGPLATETVGINDPAILKLFKVKKDIGKHSHSVQDFASKSGQRN